MFTYDVDDADVYYFIGLFKVKFSSPMKYHISRCTDGWTSLPVQPNEEPTEVPTEEIDKIWTISKTATTLRIECNGVEVLNYLFSDSSYNDCVPRWGGDIVDKIKFKSDDTASASYRAKPTGNEGV